MGTVKKALAFFLGFVVVCTAIVFLFPREKAFSRDAVIRIGAGNDISGILMEEITEELSGTYTLHQTIDMSSFADCCSNTAQWALNAAEINVGFFCSHIANYTVQKNDKVMIYAPVVMNAELIVYKEDMPWEAVRTVGVTQGREQEKNLASKAYPQIEAFRDISQKGILYALEDGQVDADILDISYAAGVPDYKTRPLIGRDYISYVLVVDKEFAGTEAFSDFLKGYNRAVRKLNDKAVLAERLQTTEEWLSGKQLKFLEID
ncbi:MAG: ABC transporter substrate-binding (seleno)protein SaoB [Eubacteriales bacterium]|nr:ABC transporter substrate-binding (seleno)protein SaoB [Eubacteriales bacterium]